MEKASRALYLRREHRESLRNIAVNFGVPESTLRGWIRRYQDLGFNR
jgi:transposase-like protein